MKITKRQLRRLIREAFDYNDAEYESEMGMVEYDMGREDALAGLPPGDDTDDYMWGYNEVLTDMGQEPVEPPAPGSGKPLDPALLKHAHVGGRLREAHSEIFHEPQRPWGTYAHKGESDEWSDIIIMSPNGDSVLVDGMETYVQDVPSQLEHASGQPVPPDFGEALVKNLESQMQSFYVEKEVTFRNGQWEANLPGF